MTQHVKRRREAKNTMLGHSLNTESTHKWSDGSHSECQLLSVISLVPQQTCEHTTTALPYTKHTHIHKLKPIQPKTKDGEEKKKKQQHSAKQSRINMRISSHSSPVKPSSSPSTLTEGPRAAERFYTSVLNPSVLL